MFSKACEYAIRSTIYIAERSNLDKRVSITDIAKAIDSPEAFTAKILQQQKKNQSYMPPKLAIITNQMQTPDTTNVCKSIGNHIFSIIG